MTTDLYQEQLLEEARAPKNQGKISDADVLAVAFNASCGDKVEMSLKLDEDKTHIIDVKWNGAGCIISQAGLSVLSQRLKGMPVADVKNLDLPDLLNWLGLSEISPGRIKCVLLGVSALKQAL